VLWRKQWSLTDLLGDWLGCICTVLSFFDGPSMTRFCYCSSSALSQSRTSRAFYGIVYWLVSRSKRQAQQKAQLTTQLRCRIFRRAEIRPHFASQPRFDSPFDISQQNVLTLMLFVCSLAPRAYLATRG